MAGLPAGPGRGTIPTMEGSLPDQLPLVPKHLIDTPAEFHKVCDHLAAGDAFGFDTEFIGEFTYQPVLCLIQVATRDRVELIDSMAIQDLSPLWKLVANPKILKICHAGEQDLAIAFGQGGLAPANVMDTQMLAGLIGMGYPLAYWKLAEEFAGISLAKAHTYSAWNRRPLTGPQFEYAVDDVRYLLKIYDRLDAELGRLNRRSWARAACQELTAAAAVKPDAQKAYLKIKAAKSYTAENLAVLRALAAWREQVAFEHNLPARSLLADEVLRDIAKNPPARLASLTKIKNFPPVDLASYGPTILELIRQVRSSPPDTWPVPPEPGDDSPRCKLYADMLWSITQVLCLGQALSTAAVTSQAELVQLAQALYERKDLGHIDILRGWRLECIGRRLLEFAAGNTNLVLSCRQQRLEIEATPAKPGSDRESKA